MSNRQMPHPSAPLVDGSGRITTPWLLYFNSQKNATSTAASSFGVNVKTDYTAKGDGTTNDLTQIQNAIDDVGAAGGGIVYLPRPDVSYYIGNGAGLTITDSNVTLIGEGPNWHESSTPLAATEITYNGTGNAITVGSSGMTDMLYGIAIKSLGIKDTANNAAAGIVFEYNSAATIFAARCLLEDVSVRNFGSGKGIYAKFGVQHTFRRCYTYINEWGIYVDNITTLFLDNVACRLNSGQGFRFNGGQGISCIASIFESNAGSGVMANSASECLNVAFRDCWFEVNNTAASSADYQMWVGASGGGTYKNFVVENCTFKGSNGSGDMYFDTLDRGSVHHCSMQRASGNALNFASSITNTYYGTINSGGGAIDPGGLATVANM